MASELSVDRNPLYNPVVLANLFKLCKLRDICRCRRVCKLWRSVSQSRFRNDISVMIRKPSLSKELYSFKWLPQEEEASDGGEEVGVAVPNRSFHLSDVDFASSSSPPDPYPPISPPPDSSPDERNGANDAQLYISQMDRFWELYGHRMRKLMLMHGQTYCVDTFKKVLFEKTPNLEELAIDSLNIPWNRNSSPPRRGDDNREEEDEPVRVQPNLTSLSVQVPYISLPISWNLIFRSFPNINDFHFCGSESDDVLSPVVNTLKKLGENKRNIMCIKTLDLDGHFYTGNGNALMALLKLPQFKLKSLEISSFKLKFKKWLEILQLVLEVHEPTLETLRVDFMDGRDRDKNASDFETYNFPFRSEPFTSLTELQVGCALFRNFHFLEQFPNLKKLSIGSCYKEIFIETDLDKMKNIKLAMVEKFEFDSIYITEAMMNMFVEVMPNCEKFIGPLLRDSLRVICKRWGQLRKLVIEGCGQTCRGYPRRIEEIDDEAITGIVPGCDVRMPNITDLKYLWKLDISHLATITDISIWNGFLQCPRLTYLHITSSIRASGEAFSALKTQLPGSMSRVQKNEDEEEDDDDDT